MTPKQREKALESYLRKQSDAFAVEVDGEVWAGSWVAVYLVDSPDLRASAMAMYGNLLGREREATQFRTQILPNALAYPLAGANLLVTPFLIENMGRVGRVFRSTDCERARDMTDVVLNADLLRVAGAASLSEAKGFDFYWDGGPGVSLRQHAGGLVAIIGRTDILEELPVLDEGAVYSQQSLF